MTLLTILGVPAFIFIVVPLIVFASLLITNINSLKQAGTPIKSVSDLSKIDWKTISLFAGASILVLLFFTLL